MYIVLRHSNIAVKYSDIRTLCSSDMSALRHNDTLKETCIDT